MIFPAENTNKVSNIFHFWSQKTYMHLFYQQFFSLFSPFFLSPSYILLYLQYSFKKFLTIPKKSSFNFVFFSLTSTKKISPSIFPKFPHQIKDTFSDSKLSSSLCDLQQRNEIIINATTEAMEQGILSKGIIK